MEGTGEISDSDSGIILHSGSDSPTTHTKDVTHTRAIKLKQQELQDHLERCLLELRGLCIREAELTGQLSKDYPLQSGEKPPRIPRRIGASFKLDKQIIPQGSQDSILNLSHADLAIQTKIYEATRKLYQEDHLSKAVKKNRLQQCKNEEKKLKQLQEATFKLQLEHGRSSPRPVLISTQQDLGTSDDSSLSDSLVQDEDVTIHSSQPFSGLPYSVETDSPQSSPVSIRSYTDRSQMSPFVAPGSPLVNFCHSPSPSLDSNLSSTSTPVSELPPIQNSPWSESSLDQPYEKTKKSRSSSKMSSPAKSDVLPPLDPCLIPSPLPQQLSHLRLSQAQSNSAPSTPEMRVHRQLSLRLSSPESSSFYKERGRSRGPRRRLTDFGITFAETPSPQPNYGIHASSEDSNSEKSYSSHGSSPCQDLPAADLPKDYQSGYSLGLPVGSFGQHIIPSPSFHSNRHMLVPDFQRSCYREEVAYLSDADVAQSRFLQQANRPPFNCWHEDYVLPQQRPQRHLPPGVRLAPLANSHHYHNPNHLSQQKVNEHLKSWHQRSQLRPPRSRSLDRQQAALMKSMTEKPCNQSHMYCDQMIQRSSVQRAADDPAGPWIVDVGSYFMSQV
ncbi:innate immunity activator b [Oryzias melastigma]|uniref:Innate immunity activator b n=1 Tax=Oryzias melastigma TaxID=30732 RepID=A0A3B3CSU6_ORYME|nr:innate immunity activator b [Oryzias melastigma]XP_024126686.1 innate immunity activator b [Oryzias melastigma]